MSIMWKVVSDTSGPENVSNTWRVKMSYSSEENHEEKNEFPTRERLTWVIYIQSCRKKTSLRFFGRGVIFFLKIIQNIFCKISDNE